MVNLTIAEKIIRGMEVSEDTKQELIALSRYSIYEAEVRRLQDQNVIEERAHEIVLREYADEIKRQNEKRPE